MKRFLVAIPKEDGGVELFAMKEWLRQHPSEVPPGLDASGSTSHNLRSGLKKLGWIAQESETEVRMIRPEDSRLASLVAELMDAESPSKEAEDVGDPTSGAYFALEHQLRDFLAENLSKIGVAGANVRLYVDPTGRDGIEYPTAIGPIDILGVDESGAFVVFELKRANAPDRAVGQLTRYMGWVSQTIGKGKTVRGVIVARTIDERLRYAASVIPNVALFEYRVEFKLTELAAYGAA